jgi:hypothetical protein
MTQTRKFKGVVKNTTFSRMIAESESHGYNTETNIAWFRNNRSHMFEAVPHGTQYMDIIMVRGVADA